MAGYFDTTAAPTLANPLLNTLLAPTVYKTGYTIYYALEGKRGSSGMYNDGGTLWAANGARDAFYGAVAAWNAVSNMQIKSYPFYYAEGDSRSSFITWVEKIDALGSESTELGHHDLPAATEQVGGFNSQHFAWSRESNAVGGYSFITFLHEIGHGLGLEHPHGSDPFPGVTGAGSIGTFGLNQGLFTVMSYNDGYEKIGMSPSLSYGWMATPGALDIAAVQAVYGANMSTRTGNDVYLLPKTNGAGTYFSCIWDAGGTDTLSAENLTMACTLDLRPATLKVEEGGGGFLSRASGIYGGFTIANGVLIENATGGSGDDRLIGNDGANQLRGGAGNDILEGGKGDDLLDGGLGVDSVSYTSLFFNYAVSTQGTTTTISRPADTGVDLVMDVERVTFADGVLQFDANDTFAQVLRAYDTVLDRTPDMLGLDFYVDQIEDRGWTLTNVANDLAGSPEFQAATGGLSNAQFVDYVYQHALGRAPDAGGLAFYTQKLDQGMSRGAFVVDLSESAEHRGLTAGLVAQGFYNTNDSYQAVALLYDSFLHRLPDEGGLIFYGEKVKSGAMSVSQVTAELAGSTEFQNGVRGMSNAQIVDYVYQNTLHRAPDAGGAAFYTDRLDHGMSIASFVSDIAFSQEHANLMSAYILGGIHLA